MADSSKSKKKTFSLGPMPAAPQPRSLEDELGSLIPLLGQLGGMSASQYISSQKELTQFQYDFFKQHYQELVNEQIAAQSRATERARTDALTYLGQWGPTARTYARQANPEWAKSMDAMMNIALGKGVPGQITNELDRLALSELKLGGALTPEEERASQQSAREAYAARGQVLGTPSAVAEVLNRDSMARQRLREREAIAGGREGAALQRGAFLGQTAQIADSTSPIWRILGMGAQTTQPENLLGWTSSVQGFNPTGIMQQGLGYGADVFNTNLNMQASMFNSYQNNAAALEAARIQSSAQIKAANAQAAASGGGGSGIGGAVVGAAGSAVAGAAAAVGLCWVARAVYGAADRRWRIFRVWLLLEAPRELRELYREQGEAIARLLARRPVARAMLAEIMKPVVAAG
jgi:hypothetical protein